MNLTELSKEIHKAAMEQGWSDDEHFVSDMNTISAHCEEANEYYYKEFAPHKLYYSADDGEPVGIPAEIAKTMICLLEACGKHGIDIQQAVDAVLEYLKKQAEKEKENV